MDVEEGLLLQMGKVEDEIKETKTINLVCYKNPHDEMSKIEIKKIHVKSIQIWVDELVHPTNFLKNSCNFKKHIV